MLSVFFSITLLELFMGGGGRLLEIGPITVRMVLFAICVVIGLLAVLYPAKRIPGMGLALCLIVVYLLIHLTSVVIGMVNGALFQDVLKEFQQSLYWLAAPFFAAVLSSERQIERVARLAKISGIILSVAYLLILLIGFLTRSLKVLDLLAYLFDQGELLQRGGGLLFYKGFLYLPIAIIFFVSMRARGWLLASMIVLTALILTLTRGLIISTSFSIIVLLVIQRRYTAVFFSMILVALAAFAVWVYLPSANDSLVNSRVVSNQQRLDDMDYMLHYATLKTVLLGEGYGTLIDYRMNIENTFMWALWKLGILGLAFWVMPFVLCLRYFLAIPRARSNGLACGFLCGTVLIYTQTMTNPFLNNPIGLSFVIMSIFSLRTMAMSSAGLRVAGNGSRQSPSGSVGTYPEYVLQPTLQ